MTKKLNASQVNLLGGTGILEGKQVSEAVERLKRDTITLYHASERTLVSGSVRVKHPEPNLFPGVVFCSDD